MLTKKIWQAIREEYSLPPTSFTLNHYKVTAYEVDHHPIPRKLEIVWVFVDKADASTPEDGIFDKEEELRKWLASQMI